MQPNKPEPTNSQQERGASEADLIQVDVNEYLEIKKELEAAGVHHNDLGFENRNELENKVKKAKQLYFESNNLVFKDCFLCVQEEQTSQFEQDEIRDYFSGYATFVNHGYHCNDVNHIIFAHE